MSNKPSPNRAESSRQLNEMGWFAQDEGYRVGWAAGDQHQGVDEERQHPHHRPNHRNFWQTRNQGERSKSFAADLLLHKLLACHQRRQVEDVETPKYHRLAAPQRQSTSHPGCLPACGSSTHLGWLFGLQELEAQGYVCPKCKKTFTTFDAGSLYDPFENRMRCDVCGADVEDNSTQAEAQASKDRLQRLIKQTGSLRDLLKKMDEVVLPE